MCNVFKFQAEIGTRQGVIEHEVRAVCYNEDRGMHMRCHGHMALQLTSSQATTCSPRTKKKSPRNHTSPPGKNVELIALRSLPDVQEPVYSRSAHSQATTHHGLRTLVQSASM